MDFFVNGQNFDITIEDEKTIGDVLKSFQIYCDENEAAVIGIKINDNIVTADNFDDVKTQELSDSTKFEFNIITLLFIILHRLLSLREPLRLLS